MVLEIYLIGKIADGVFMSLRDHHSPVTVLPTSTCQISDVGGWKHELSLLPFVHHTSVWRADPDIENKETTSSP